MNSSSEDILPAEEMVILVQFPAYAVSSDGRVWTRRVNRGGGNYPPEGPWKPLRPGIGPNGYPTVGIHWEGKQKSHYVHRLVLEAFVGKCPPHHVCCHENGVRTDNRLANLRWGTIRQNSGDATGHGTKSRPPRFIGSQHTNAKIAEDDVRMIRKLYAEGLGPGTIAKRFPIGESTVMRIVKRESWAHVP